MDKPSTPGVTILLPLEAAPVVVVDALDEREEQRIRDWIDASPGRASLVRQALALREEAKAA